MPGIGSRVSESTWSRSVVNAFWETLNGWGILAALAAGIGLGLIYFGGLWWTVRRLPTWQRPELAFLASFAIRMVISLVGLLLMVRAGVPYLITGLVAMVLVRIYLTRRFGPVHSIRPGE